MLTFLDDVPDRSLEGTALVRIDVNAADDWRLRAVLPTIEHVAARARLTVVISHKGRPTPGKPLGKLSLRSDAQQLAELTEREVWFVSDTTVPAVRRELKKVPDGAIAVLENIRAFKGEAADSAAFSKSLASLGDYYVSDAFPVLHHPAASVTGLPALLPAYAGFQLKEELARLGSLATRVRRPYVVVIGGAKAKDKLGVLESCLARADRVLVGGACANALLALSGVDVGSSLYERDPELLEALRPYVGHRKIELPTDFVRSGGKILDIGPKTARRFAQAVAGAGTVLWTGPLGMIEQARFSAGSLAVARAVARNRKAFSVTGGGETVTFLKRHGLDRAFSFLSTGGGAMIDLVAGHALPGLEALRGGTQASGRKAASRKTAKKAARTASKKPATAKRRSAKDERSLAPVYDIFFHDDLDGRASAAVFVDFLMSRGSRIERFVPVEHDVGDAWLKKDALDTLAGTPKRNPAIVVDFPYHPQAVFWYDHHPTAFRLPAWQQRFQSSAYQQLDPSYLSACRLTIDALVAGFDYRPPAFIRELGRWLDIIDGARYANAFQTIALREPALQVNAYLEHETSSAKRGDGERDPVHWLIEALARMPIGTVARDRRVREVTALVRAETKASLSLYRRLLDVRGCVAVVDISELSTRRLRFAPYYLAPNAVFAVTIAGRGDDTWVVMVGVNPWKRERSSLDIGGLLTHFGGGGHPYAGAVLLRSRAEVERVTDYFVTLFNGAAA